MIVIQIEIQHSFKVAFQILIVFYHKLKFLTFDFLITEMQISLTLIFIGTLLQLSSATKCKIYHLTLKFRV